MCTNNGRCCEVLWLCRLQPAGGAFQPGPSGCAVILGSPHVRHDDNECARYAMPTCRDVNDGFLLPQRTARDTGIHVCLCCTGSCARTYKPSFLHLGRALQLATYAARASVTPWQPAAKSPAAPSTPAHATRATSGMATLTASHPVGTNRKCTPSHLPVYRIGYDGIGYVMECQAFHASLGQAWA